MKTRHIFNFNSFLKFSFIIFSLLVLSNYLYAQQKSLLIEGNNIWVRDRPGTGEVVMKLNDGDSCGFDFPRQFEIIRGTPHYWYPIQYKGQYGYVFGSQTNQEFTDLPLKSANPEELWERFKNHYLTQAKKQKEEWDDFDYEFEDRGSSFQYNFVEDGPSDLLFSLDTIVNREIIIIKQEGKIAGAAGFANSFKSFVGLYRNGNYELYPDFKQSFQGVLKHLIPINENEYLMASFYDSGDGIAMFRTSYFEVYYINTKDHTIRLIANELGKAIDGVYVEDVKVENLFNTKVDMKYKNGDKHFTLIEHRAKKTDEYLGFEPHDILKTKYKWNVRQFTLEKLSD
ncbi:hypothetical protein MATR_34040 [Marivirga tractuosa]|uniref:Uncharacterized protein n=1 Tax=Marivirga tractuosa (strain ATCC 23168 / DSM 4126 / NBRC 15989 / NCIMB 1408 / VKM B-1430 / H-43) TaxID=643867 RepID=E4TRQ1_MARTH|nr:hypothetical protein [Marivirga tractuosa]ADR22750.1 hypothetical protein Ftrac_2772 [Marivirga tractuosa DSM 4126]BDD16579.1 hypothetical protein MATR_34040 [Marivirga tractuosa]